MNSDALPGLSARRGVALMAMSARPPDERTI